MACQCHAQRKHGPGCSRDCKSDPPCTPTHIFCFTSWRSDSTPGSDFQSEAIALAVGAQGRRLRSIDKNPAKPRFGSLTLLMRVQPLECKRPQLPDCAHRHPRWCWVGSCVRGQAGGTRGRLDDTGARNCVTHARDRRHSRLGRCAAPAGSCGSGRGRRTRAAGRPPPQPPPPRRCGPLPPLTSAQLQGQGGGRLEHTRTHLGCRPAGRCAHAGGAGVCKPRPGTRAALKPGRRTQPTSWQWQTPSQTHRAIQRTAGCGCSRGGVGQVGRTRISGAGCASHTTRVHGACAVTAAACSPRLARCPLATID